ncbi:Zinc finger, C2H2-type/integrase, DNA-binding protein, partial [Metarhizium brunneum ARSEF 3297]
MEVSSSFSSRRSAAGSLPPFSLPPPNEVPSMALFTHRPSSPFGFFPSSPLTSSPGASDGLSPGLSSVNTASSQGSQAHGNMQYTYSANVHGTWPTPGTSNYSVGGTSPDQSYGGHRSSIYGQPPTMGFGNPRSSQSPATGGEGLPPPPFNGVHQPFQTSISGGGGSGGQDGHHISGQAPPQGAMLSSTQPHAAGSAPAPVDPYSHSRPPSNPSYYPASSATQQASFSSYAGPQQPSPTGTSPGSRGLGHSAMAPPYRPYGSYQPLTTMNGPVMSNIHQPGSQLSMIPAMGVPPGYNHQMMYGHHPQPQPQSERPFKCDQCTQSFSRNHDLKRHKRIHLAVKPFPCSFCSKSFSRKDALKRHRLVKGCENKSNEAAAADDAAAQERAGEGDDDRSSLGKEV